MTILIGILLIWWYSSWLQQFLKMPVETKPISDYDWDDDNSAVSSLQCGSIPPNAAYDPARDPRNFAFIPPVHIVVKVKVQVPPWLRINSCESPSPSVSNVVEIAQTYSNHDDVYDWRRQVSWDSNERTRQEQVIMVYRYAMRRDKLEQRWNKSCPDFNRKTARSTRSNLRASPTHLAGDQDTSSAFQDVGPPDQQLVHRVSLFQRRKSEITLRQPLGCLT